MVADKLHRNTFSDSRLRYDVPVHRYSRSRDGRGTRVSRSVDRDSTSGVDYSSSNFYSEYANVALTRPLLQRRFSLSAIRAGSAFGTQDNTSLTDAERDFSGTQLKSASRVRSSRKDVVYTAENMRFSRECTTGHTGKTVYAHGSSRYMHVPYNVSERNTKSRTGSVPRFVNDHTEDRRHHVKMRASSVPRTDNMAIRSGHTGISSPVHRRARSVARTYRVDVDRRRPSYTYKNYGATAAIHTEENDGFDIASFILSPGEQFIPTNVSVDILPSGKKAITYTRFSQKGTGDQHKANVEIDRIIQRTNRLQESMHTLESFVKRNRSLFPEDIIIYQHIIFYLLDNDELKRLGEYRPGSEVYGVKIRERLVAPFGTDVANVLKKYYSKHSNVEVEYMEREDIRRRLKEEMEEPEPYQKVPRTSQLKTEANQVNVIQKNGEASSSIDDSETSDRYRWKGITGESAPHFVQWLRPNSVREGDCCRFTCSVIGEPEPTMTWYKDGKQLHNSERFRFQNVLGLCSLEVRDVESGDAGVYTVRACNAMGEVASNAKLLVYVEKECSVINQHDVVKKPWFLIDPSNTVAEVGQQVLFEAQATGQPMPSTKWKKDNADVILDDRFHVISEEPGNTKLVIHNVQLSDSGVYFCVAENVKGKVKSAATLRVSVPGDSSADELCDRTTFGIDRNNESLFLSTPKFRSESLLRQGRQPHFIQRPPLEINALEAESLTLRCVVEGNPKPIVTWYKGVRELTYSKRHRVMAEVGNSYMMQIKSVLQTDPGQYTAVATNDFGQAHVTVFVNVRPKLVEDSNVTWKNLNRNTNEMELSRKIHREYMPPIFIIKLPREKTIKVGATLLFNCFVEKTELQESLIGVDVFVKDTGQISSDSTCQQDAVNE